MMAVMIMNFCLWREFMNSPLLKARRPLGQGDQPLEVQFSSSWGKGGEDKE
jgi:hypothetical protein